jgi:hypothetical protein
MGRSIGLSLLILAVLAASAVQAQQTPPRDLGLDFQAPAAAPAAPTGANSWLGKYPMSIFTKTRTAKLVGKGHLSLCMKFQSFDYDDMSTIGGYKELDPGDSFRQMKACFVAKYGWAKNHHVVLGIPYMWTDHHIGSKDLETNHLGNVFVFDKWQLIKETRCCPAVAFDTWIYFPTGDATQKCGSDDTSVKFTTEVSKALNERWSIHFNPGYMINCGGGPDCTEINTALLWKRWKKLWPAVEYNYLYKDGKGECHDVVPGVIWKYTKGSSFKCGVVINGGSTMAYRDDVGLVMKFFHRF